MLKLSLNILFFLLLIPEPIALDAKKIDLHLTNDTNLYKNYASQLNHFPFTHPTNYFGMSDSSQEESATTTSIVDHSKTTILSKTASYSVGKDGDFTTLAEAFTWLGSRQIAHNVRINIRLLPGDHYVESLLFHHKDSAKISLIGYEGNKNINVNQMSGDRAKDANIIKDTFSSRIHLSGVNGYGLHLCNGLGLVKNIAFFSKARYSLVLGGFKGNYQHGCDHATVNIDNIAIYGGVWGLLAVSADIRVVSKIFFAHHEGDNKTEAGGAMLFRNVNLISNLLSNRIEAYIPKSKYFLNVQNSNIDMANSVRALGMGTVVDAHGLTSVNLVGAHLSKGGNLAQTYDNSSVHLSNSTVDDFDTSKVTASFNIYPGFSVGILRNMINIGQNGTVTSRNLIVKNSAMERFLFLDGGELTGLDVTLDNNTTFHKSQGLGRNSTGRIKLQLKITNHIGNTTINTDYNGRTNMLDSSGYSEHKTLKRLNK